MYRWELQREERQVGRERGMGRGHVNQKNIYRKRVGQREEKKRVMVRRKRWNKGRRRNAVGRVVKNKL